MTLMIRRMLLPWVLLAAPVMAFGQAVRVPQATAKPRSLLGNTLVQLSVSPSIVAINLVRGGQAFSTTPIAITSTVTNPLLTTVNIFAFFANPVAALTGVKAGKMIPTSAIAGLVPTGLPTTYTAFTQTNTLGAAGASLKLVTVTGLVLLHTQTDNLSLRVDLTPSGLATLIPDTYTGTLTLQAQIF